MLLQSDNAIINTLTMILNTNNLLMGNLNFDYYKSFFTNDELYSSNWLFVYECCNQGWLNQDKDKDYIKNDEFYKQLLDNKISFINAKSSVVATVLRNVVLENMDMESIINCVRSIKTIRENVLLVGEKLACTIDDDIIEEVTLEIFKKVEEPKKDLEKEPNEEIEEEQKKDHEKEPNEEIEEEQKKDLEKEPNEETKKEPEEGQFRNIDWLMNFFNTDISKKNTIFSNDIDTDDEY